VGWTRRCRCKTNAHTHRCRCNGSCLGHRSGRFELTVENISGTREVKCKKIKLRHLKSAAQHRKPANELMTMTSSTRQLNPTRRSTLDPAKPRFDDTVPRFVEDLPEIEADTDMGDRLSQPTIVDLVNLLNTCASPTFAAEYRKPEPSWQMQRSSGYGCPFRIRNPVRFNPRDHSVCATTSFPDLPMLKCVRPVCFYATVAAMLIPIQATRP
jgi:hypothetical protein